MCKIGDIIIVNSYKHNGIELHRHSFVVIDDENGEICGLEYNFIANVLSSFKDEEQKKRKLAYPGNFPIANDDTFTIPDDGKDGYLKTDQLYYFNKDAIDFRTIGYVMPEIMELIIEFINTSTFDIEAITDNIKNE